MNGIWKVKEIQEDWEEGINAQYTRKERKQKQATT